MSMLQRLADAAAAAAAHPDPKVHVARGMAEEMRDGRPQRRASVGGASLNAQERRLLGYAHARVAAAEEWGRKWRAHVLASPGAAGAAGSASSPGAAPTDQWDVYRAFADRQSWQPAVAATKPTPSVVQLGALARIPTPWARSTPHPIGPHAWTPVLAAARRGVDGKLAPTATTGRMQRRQSEGHITLRTTPPKPAPKPVQPASIATVCVTAQLPQLPDEPAALLRLQHEWALALLKRSGDQPWNTAAEALQRSGRVTDAGFAELQTRPAFAAQAIYAQAETLGKAAQGCALGAAILLKGGHTGAAKVLMGAGGVATIKAALMTGSMFGAAVAAGYLWLALAPDDDDDDASGSALEALREEVAALMSQLVDAEDRIRADIRGVRAGVADADLRTLVECRRLRDAGASMLDIMTHGLADVRANLLSVQRELGTLDGALAHLTDNFNAFRAEGMSEVFNDLVYDTALPDPLPTAEVHGFLRRMNHILDVVLPNVSRASALADIAGNVNDPAILRMLQQWIPTLIAQLPDGQRSAVHTRMQATLRQRCAAAVALADTLRLREDVDVPAVQAAEEHRLRADNVAAVARQVARSMGTLRDALAGFDPTLHWQAYETTAKYLVEGLRPNGQRICHRKYRHSSTPPMSNDFLRRLANGEFGRWCYCSDVGWDTGFPCICDGHDEIEYARSHPPRWPDGRVVAGDHTEVAPFLDALRAYGAQRWAEVRALAANAAGVWPWAAPAATVRFGTVSAVVPTAVLARVCGAVLDPVLATWTADLWTGPLTLQATLAQAGDAGADGLTPYSLHLEFLLREDVLAAVPLSLRVDAPHPMLGALEHMWDVLLGGKYADAVHTLVVTFVHADRRKPHLEYRYMCPTDHAVPVAHEDATAPVATALAPLLLAQARTAEALRAAAAEAPAVANAAKTKEQVARLNDAIRAFRRDAAFLTLAADA